MRTTVVSDTITNTSLKDNGILYCSFKKGTGTRVDEKKRFYNDILEDMK